MHTALNPSPGSLQLSRPNDRPLAPPLSVLCLAQRPQVLLLHLPTPSQHPVKRPRSHQQRAPTAGRLGGWGTRLPSSTTPTAPPNPTNPTQVCSTADQTTRLMAQLGHARAQRVRLT